MIKRPILAAKAAQAAEAELVESQVEQLQLETVDEPQQLDQSHRQGSIAQGDPDVAERINKIAQKFGHRAQEELDPGKAWQDPYAYLENSADHYAKLKERYGAMRERLQRTTQAAADAIEEDRRQAREAAQAEIKAAAEAQDTDRVSKAADRLEQLSPPPPQTVAWMAKNTWFHSDPDAKLIATATANRLMREGRSIEDQLQAAEAIVRKRFPEHFEGPSLDEDFLDEPSARQARREEPRQEAEVRLSDSRRVQAPPAVSEGNRARVGAPKEKGYNDIPQGDRFLFSQKLLPKYIGRGMTAEQAKTRWAGAYWRENG